MRRICCETGSLWALNKGHGELMILRDTMSELPMRTTCFSVALCKGTVYRNVSDSRQEGRTSDTRLLRRKNKKAFSCVCSESDRVW